MKTSKRYTVKRATETMDTVLNYAMAIAALAYVVHLILSSNPSVGF